MCLVGNVFTPRCCILEDFLQPIASPVQSVDKITQTNFICVLEYQLISLKKECTFATWLNSSSRFFLVVVRTEILLQSIYSRPPRSI